MTWLTFVALAILVPINLSDALGQTITESKIVINSEYIFFELNVTNNGTSQLVSVGTPGREINMGPNKFTVESYTSYGRGVATVSKLYVVVTLVEGKPLFSFQPGEQIDFLYCSRCWGLTLTLSPQRTEITTLPRYTTFGLFGLAGGNISLVMAIGSSLFRFLTFFRRRPYSPSPVIELGNVKNLTDKIPPV